ncbi:WbqC family protein [Flagellimonas sp. 389]|uniref:WbqC family protein n=1 Tax=Flagellimonas sp. 389 TaxID=2835862 RepID=UPI001BD56BE5|nr:WbqC family protein [Flagellimonas sp. 389]MBS9461465.1 WbqC family protein [Flagellimonas sp. 389]
MKTLVHPTYFPNIITFAVIVQNDVIWEGHDNFQKQTYRNRCYIATDQGKHMLNIPIKHVGGKEGRQKYHAVEVDNSTNWQKLHWRTLETAYRTSPFFEFYEDDLKPLFEEPASLLYDFNLKTIAIIGECLGIKTPMERNVSFEKKSKELIDSRLLVDAKKSPTIAVDEYAQVFGERNGFIANLSILDLLFNEGTNTLTFLKNLSLNA